MKVRELRKSKTAKDVIRDILSKPEPTTGVPYARFGRGRLSTGGFNSETLTATAQYGLASYCYLLNGELRNRRVTLEQLCTLIRASYMPSPRLEATVSAIMKVWRSNYVQLKA